MACGHVDRLAATTEGLVTVRPRVRAFVRMSRACVHVCMCAVRAAYVHVPDAASNSWLYRCPYKCLYTSLHMTQLYGMGAIGLGKVFEKL